MFKAVLTHCQSVGKVPSVADIREAFRISEVTAKKYAREIRRLWHSSSEISATFL